MTLRLSNMVMMKAGASAESVKMNPRNQVAGSRIISDSSTFFGPIMILIRCTILLRSVMVNMGKFDESVKTGKSCKKTAKGFRWNVLNL